jgi:hypothetical protein
MARRVELLEATALDVDDRLLASAFQGIVNRTAKDCATAALLFIDYGTYDDPSSNATTSTTYTGTRDDRAWSLKGPQGSRRPSLCTGTSFRASWSPTRSSPTASTQPWSLRAWKGSSWSPRAANPGPGRSASSGGMTSAAASGAASDSTSGPSPNCAPAVQKLPQPPTSQPGTAPNQWTSS